MHIADLYYKWRIERNEVKMGKLFSFDFDDGKYALRRSRARAPNSSQVPSLIKVPPPQL